MKTIVNLSTGEIETRDLTPEEIAALPEPQALVRDYAAEIAALERDTLLPRPVRDFMLIFMETAAVEQGAAQGLTAEQSIQVLRANNSGYRKVKELDEQIAALRALL